jgi:hypothetical protein
MKRIFLVLDQRSFSAGGATTQSISIAWGQDGFGKKKFPKEAFYQESPGQ